MKAVEGLQRGLPSEVKSLSGKLFSQRTQFRIFNSHKYLVKSAEWVTLCSTNMCANGVPTICPMFKEIRNNKAKFMQVSLMIDWYPLHTTISLRQ